MSGIRRYARDLDDQVDRIERLCRLTLDPWQRKMLRTILPEGPRDTPRLVSWLRRRP